MTKNQQKFNYLMNTRRNVDHSLLQVEDPEHIIRNAHRTSMAAKQDNRDRIPGDPEWQQVPGNEEEDGSNGR